MICPGDVITATSRIFAYRSPHFTAQAMTTWGIVQDGTGLCISSNEKWLLVLVDGVLAYFPAQNFEVVR